MDVLQYNIIQAVLWHGGSGACTAASRQDSHGFNSRMGHCWLWGAGPPQTFNAQVGYLPGLSVWSLHVLPWSQGVSYNKNPNRKNMQKQNILLSIRARDGRT